MASYESVVLVKQEVFVYKIPPRSTNRGYRWVVLAKTWNFLFLITISLEAFCFRIFFPLVYCSRACFILSSIFVLCRAADWNLNEPTWNGRMRMVSAGPQLNIKLEDKMSGQLFANCPVEAYPGVAIEPVSDSSRYFVLRIQDDNGRSAFIGIGFGVSSSEIFYVSSMKNIFCVCFRTDQIRLISTLRCKITLSM